MTEVIERSNWIDQLRSSITLLVIAHHAALAYTTFGYFEPTAYILSTHPVVDKNRWIGFYIFVSVIDTFFMPLMFFISGVFMLSSLQKKSAAAFLRDRFFRLFIPFFVGVTVLMLIAYYPAWLLAGKHSDLRAYVIDFFTVEAWPVGPPWFIWLLFLFNCIFIVFRHLLIPVIRKTALLIPGATALSMFLWLFLGGCVLYVPFALLYGPYTWTGFGPFDFQLARVLLYFGYFIAGAMMGAINYNTVLFGSSGSIDKNLKNNLTGFFVSFTALFFSRIF